MKMASADVLGEEEEVEEMEEGGFLFASHLHISGGKVSKRAKSQHPAKYLSLLSAISHRTRHSRIYYYMEDGGSWQIQAQLSL